MQKCALSVDELEALSGIDFFAELDDDFENRVEATYNLRNWGL
jgi:endonuclease G